MTFIIFRNTKRSLERCNRQLKLFCTETSPTPPNNEEEVELKHFPNKIQLLRQSYNIYKKDEFYQRFLLNELLKESGINRAIFPLVGVDKKFILDIDIEILKKIGFVKSEKEILNQMINHLESFPFAQENFNSLSNYVTIRRIRDVVEKHYLAWKFKADIKLITNTMICFKPYLIEERSCKNISRCFNIVNSIPTITNYSMVSKIFFIYMRPFDVKNILRCPENFFNYDWDNAVHLFPDLLSKPYPYVRQLLKVLEEKQFTNSQIKNSLPFLKIGLLSLLKRLNYMLSNSYLSNYIHHEDFLKLVFFNEKNLKFMVETQDLGFSELQRLIDIDDNNIERKSKLQGLCHQIQKMLKVDEETLKKLQNHSQIHLSSEVQISDTIKFLNRKKFTNEEIIESITIVLYKRSKIINALKKMKKEEENLEKLGFINGCVPDETNFFNKGTKLKKKILQLCLYYLEKNHNF